MNDKAECAPKITRVHTLHRIRTVVNYVNELDKENAPIIDDFTIANHLISMHLSKPTTDSFRDQIGRRARDHLETARYLGLLFRQKFGHKYKHLATSLGKKLYIYAFEEECPKNYSEEAILIDRICRMKLTNASYMQTPRGYQNYRSRICLNILAAIYLNNTALSVFQLGTILSNQVLDIFFHKKEFDLLIKKINSEKYEKQYLNKLTSVDKRNVRRDTLPYIDWCAQLDLVRKKDDLVFITNRGQKIYEFYRKMMPIWWHDFTKWPEVASSVILLINYFKAKGQKSLIKKMIKKATKFGLFEISIEKIMKHNLGKYYEDALESNLVFDFSAQYDIPPKSFKDVKDIMQSILNKIGYEKSALEIIKYLEFYCMKRISSKLRKDAAKISKDIKDKQQIDVTVLSASILSQFKSPYEATAYLHFKAIGSENYKVEKYQAQLSEFFLESLQYKNFSRNNPDLLLTNDFLGLIECKSTKEWGEILSLRKGIIAEIEFYHHYCDAIKELGINKNCTAIICYEGQLKPEDKKEIVQLIKDKYPNIVIITSSMLQKALVDNSTKNSLKALTEGIEKEVTL